jgi:hypothetical protein
MSVLMIDPNRLPARIFLSTAKSAKSAETNALLFALFAFFAVNPFLFGCGCAALSSLRLIHPKAPLAG